MLRARALVRAQNDAKNRAQQGCAMQFSGITLKIANGERLTSWLFTKREVVEFGASEHKSIL